MINTGDSAVWNDNPEEQKLAPIDAMILPSLNLNATSENQCDKDTIDLTQRTEQASIVNSRFAELMPHSY